jgi:hypothetical protein
MCRVYTVKPWDLLFYTLRLPTKNALSHLYTAASAVLLLTLAQGVSTLVTRRKKSNYPLASVPVPQSLFLYYSHFGLAEAGPLQAVPLHSNIDASLP